MVHSGVYTLLSIIEILFCCTDESNVVSGLDPSKSKAAPPEVCSAMHFGQPQTTLHEAAGKVKYLQSFLKENFMQSYSWLSDIRGVLLIVFPDFVPPPHTFSCKKIAFSPRNFHVIPLEWTFLIAGFFFFNFSPRGHSRDPPPTGWTSVDFLLTPLPLFLST